VLELELLEAGLKNVFPAASSVSIELLGNPGEQNEAMVAFELGA
jgi:hypothetical protein